MQGFRALKVESKNCETSGRQPKLHDGSEQISTPFVVNLIFNVKVKMNYLHFNSISRKIIMEVLMAPSQKCLLIKVNLQKKM